MGFLSGLIGNASQIDGQRIQTEYARILVPEERVEAAFQLVRDQFIFTDRRLMLIDKQGLTGKKIEYLSLPYRSIARFSVETAGHFDLDAELKIWLSGLPEPIKWQFTKDVDIYAVQSILAAYVLR